MVKAYLKYLLLGVIAWGAIIGLINIYFLTIGSSIINGGSITKILVLHIIATVLITAACLHWSVGFLFKDPKKWFFLPLIRWVIVLAIEYFDI